LNVTRSPKMIFNKPCYGEDVFKMSASRERKKRLEERAKEALNPSGRKKRNQKRFRKGLLRAVAVLAVVAVVFLYLAGSGVFQANLTALSIGDVGIKGAEFDYHYYRAVHTYYNQYAQWYSMYGMELFDPTKPLNKQESQSLFGSMEEETWGEYFQNQAIESLTTIVNQSEQAKKENITLTEADRKKIDAEVAQIETAAEEGKLRPDRFLKKNYGQGISLKKVREYLERLYLSERYKTTLTAGFEEARDDTDVLNHYDENRGKYDYVKYNSFTISKTMPEVEGDTDEYGEPVERTTDEIEAYENGQKALAEDMLRRVTTSEAFEALSREYAETEPEPESEPADTDTDTDAANPEDEDGDEPDTDEPVDSTLTDSLVDNLTEVYKDYLSDTKRKPGDKKLLEDDNGFYVVRFNERYRKEGATVNVRHILVKFPEGEEYEDEDTDTDTGADESAVSAKAKAKAKGDAQAILDQWKSGEKTAESFAALAQEKSEDEGSRYEGGLIEKVTEDSELVKPFLEWCMDKGRKPGDTGLVETEYGFHVMYFDKNLYPAWKNSVITDLNTEAYDARYEEISKDIEAKTKFLGMMFTRSPLRA